MVIKESKLSLSSCFPPQTLSKKGKGFGLVYHVEWLFGVMLRRMLKRVYCPICRNWRLSLELKLSVVLNYIQILHILPSVKGGFLTPLSFHVSKC